MDETTISQTIHHGFLSDVQHAVTTVEDWCRSQRVQVNADKCKDRVPLSRVDANELPVHVCAKILGATISSDLKWNNHIVDCIKKKKKQINVVFHCSLEKGSCSPS